jgi:hypothetical protein
MIDPKELRIRNWIKSIAQGDIQVKASDIADIEKIETVFLKGQDYFQPIPLTPEWLERLGFEYDKYMLWWTNKKVSIFNAIRTTNNKDFFVVSCYGQTKPIRSVHDLQNLIFCLTGEEL